jgi:hypothetical protein
MRLAILPAFVLPQKHDRRLSHFGNPGFKRVGLHHTVLPVAIRAGEPRSRKTGRKIVYFFRKCESQVRNIPHPHYYAEAETRSDLFSSYLMFQPASSGADESDWIPLARIDWNFQFTENGNAFQLADVHLTSKSGPAPHGPFFGIPEPEWMKVLLIGGDVVAGNG